MWELRCLITLWAFTASYRDTFAFTFVAVLHSPVYVWSLFWRNYILSDWLTDWLCILYVFPCFLYPPIHLPTKLPTLPPIHLSVFLIDNLCICLSVRPSLFHPIYIYIYIYIYRERERERERERKKESCIQIVAAPNFHILRNNISDKF
jgi:hypothetical protein